MGFLIVFFGGIFAGFILGIYLWIKGAPVRKQRELDAAYDRDLKRRAMEKIANG